MPEKQNLQELSTTFGLLRHGETLWNSSKRIQGSEDSPLSAKGEQQIGQWAQTLCQWHWDRVVASDLGRVRQTVEIVNRSLALPVQYNSQLREQSWGDWEGLTIPHIKKHFSDELQRQIARGWKFSAPGGETRASVRDRVFATLLELHRQYPGQKILIICHHGVIKAVLYQIAGRAFLPDEDNLIEHNNFHLIDCCRGSFSSRQLNIPRTFTRPPRQP
jgi:broad specificity phosphatase PhoE